ncbi:MAG: DinB family protein, partial [Candidatus Acidiferrales bacterium]
LAHLVLVEWVWLERWQGRSPKSIPADEFSTAGAVEERWRRVERDLRSYLGGLNDGALAVPLTYVNLRGQTCTYPLGKVVWHLVNHQTYHRGQVTTLLRQLGATPVGVDYTLYLDTRK